MPKAWWQTDDFAPDRSVEHMTCEVDDVPLMQPIGFVWHSKPRYRVKAVSRKIEGDPIMAMKRKGKGGKKGGGC